MRCFILPSCHSGTRSQANYDEQLVKLQAALAAAGLVTHGQPVLVRYNGPMTPKFMRRNEVGEEVW